MSRRLPLKIFKSLPSYIALFHLLFFLSFPLVSSKAIAQDTGSRAYVIKAGFIYHFTRFIKWPPNTASQDKYNICVIGENPFGSILDRLAEKHRSKDQPLEINLDVSKSEIQGCHMLFVSFSKRFDLEDIVEQAKEYPVLTIGDTEGFAERGVDINLLVVENRVKLKINKQCLDYKGFEVSSELLDLAEIVQGGACR